MRTRKYLHTVGTRFYWRLIQRRWRAENPERAKEIRRRYFRKKRVHLTSKKKGGKGMKKIVDEKVRGTVIVKSREIQKLEKRMRKVKTE